MKKKIINLGFCRLYYAEGDEDIKKWVRMIKKAFKYTSHFFKKSIPKFNILFIYSRKEMNRLWGRKTPNFIISFANRKGIVIFSPETIEKETCWRKSDFYSTLVHEISHLFFKSITHRNVPIWLNEGIATYLQNNKKSPKKKMKLYYSILNRRFNKKSALNYEMYYSFVFYLIRRYKKEKIILLLKRLKEKGNKERLFLQVYNKSLKELIKDANEI